MRKFLRAFLVLSLAACLLAVPVSANVPPSVELGESIPLETAAIRVLLIACGILIALLLTCFSEWLMATFFDLDRSYGSLIVRTNLVSQSLMWVVVLAAVLADGSTFSQYYIPILVGLELLIYSGEFAVYRRKMQDVSWKRCLLFAVSANTVSLLLGLVINQLF